MKSLLVEYTEIDSNKASVSSSMTAIRRGDVAADVSLLPLLLTLLLQNFEKMRLCHRFVLMPRWPVASVSLKASFRTTAFRMQLLQMLLLLRPGIEEWMMARLRVEPEAHVVARVYEEVAKDSPDHGKVVERKTTSKATRDMIICCLLGLTFGTEQKN
jgi:hypothetical protein